MERNWLLLLPLGEQAGAACGDGDADAEGALFVVVGVDLRRGRRVEGLTAYVVPVRMAVRASVSYLIKDASLIYIGHGILTSK